MLLDSPKLLTIIVPTYNRKESLAKGLRALIPQVENHRDDVDLYVSDNCSDDGTQEVVRELQAQHPGLITYKRQPSNLGAQGNFKDAVKSVNSKFVAIFSDDDCVLPGYIDVIFSQLNKYPQVGLVNYNALRASASMQYVGVRDSMITNGVPKYYATGGEFIKEHTHVPSLVSSNVFDRQAFVDCIDKVNIDDYPGYCWYAILLKSIFSKPCVYIDRPLFICYDPVQQRWERDAAWFTAYGLTHLFSDLDGDCNGILEAWRQAFERAGYPMVCLNLIAKYQQCYKERYDLLMRYPVSDYFSKNLKYYVFHSRLYRYVVRNLPLRLVKKARTLLHV